MRSAALGLALVLLLLGAPAQTGVAASKGIAPGDLPSGFEQTLARREYQASASARGLQAPNRAQDLRTYFEPTGIRVHERTGSGAALLSLTLASVGRAGALEPVAPGEVAHEAARVEIRRPGIVEWYLNSELGLEQGFTLAERPTGEGALVLELALSGASATPLGDALSFSTRSGRRLRYGSLHVLDASGRTLQARFEVPSPSRVQIAVDDAGAEYPLVIDPLLSQSSDAALESDQAGAAFGYTVASAGDVNGDGYGDVIVGAAQYDLGENQEGAAFVFHGGPTGIASGDPSSANATLQSNQVNGLLGTVAGAGDVNGDGYGDVIVGAGGYDAGQGFGEGAAFVFLGGASGIPSGNPSTAAAQLESNQAGASFGQSLAAGDVNGDGYSDVVVGAVYYDAGQGPSEGAAFVFHGSASGIPSGSPATAAAQLEGDALIEFSLVLDSAGDVNGDGYADVIVGAYLYESGQSAEGGAFVFHGGPTGVANGNPSTAQAVLQSDQADTWFGISVAGAGDVNGDGYADVIVGAPFYAAGELEEGVAFVFHGSPTGVSSGNPASANAVLESNLVSAWFGNAVAGAGDVNGDGYADVLVAAVGFSSGEPSEGAAFVFRGGPSGVGNGNPGTAAALVQSDQEDATFGFHVSDAGDVNGDGYADVIVSATGFDAGENNEGAAFVYHGGAEGLVDGNPATAAAQLESNQALAEFGGVAGAGDVNGDGYTDVIVGAPAYDSGEIDEGAAFVFLGGPSGVAQGDPGNAAAQLESNQVGAELGNSVAGAGDVNGDGYADVIVGAWYYDGSGTDTGGAFIFHGSASGIANGSPATAATRLVFDQPESFYNVASAGDVNGDGYADVVVGAPWYTSGESEEGAAFVYLGSASGVADGSPATAAARLESNQQDAQLGTSVAGAGDVNGDGYGDLLVGAFGYDAGELDEGAAFVFLGSATGIASGGPSIASAQLESDQAGAGLGGAPTSAAGAGDVNGDGYADVIVAAYVYESGESTEGAAFVFHGGPSGVADGSPSTAQAQLESDQVDSWVTSVAGIGDVNGDGYADVIVGSPYYDGPETDEGVAFVFLGSASGISDGNPSTAAATLETDQADSGGLFQLAAAGDVNGDGFADVIVGADAYDAGQGAWEGAAFLFYGNGNRTGRSVLARQLRGGGSATPVAPWGVSNDADGFVARMVATHPQGRGRVKLQVELCPPSVSFGQPGCLTRTQPAWTAIAPPSSSVTLTQAITGLTPGTLYRWRARTLHAPAIAATDPASPAHGPWRRLHAQSAEADIRAAGDTDGDGLPDAFELAYGLDPQDPDEDSDDRVDGQDDFDGDGLGNAAEYLAGTNPNVADSDGDTLLDGQEIGTGIFGGQLVISTAAGGAWSVSAADVDGDGDTDALSASYLSWKVAWHENDGTPSVGAWSEHAISTATLGATSAVASDVDGDGDTDVISTSFVDDKIVWFENDGTPSVGAWSEHLISTVDSPDDAVAADVDGDGDPDVISALFYDDRIAWYENDGTPSVGAWTEHEISTADDGVDSVVAADLDADGDTDVLSSSFYDDKIAWFENDGTPALGSWTEHVISTAADSAESVFAADVDGDGDTDVLSASLYDDKIAWYENDGTPSVGGWIERSISTTAAGAVSVFAVDVDGDGDTDVLSASYNDDTIAWYENDGTPLLGSWTKHVISTAADAGLSVVAADVDGDGDMDVLSASNLDNKIAWYAQQNVADPLDSDSDDDGLQDAPEVALGTDPLDEDTDDDLVCDGGAQTGSCTATGPDNCPFITNFAQVNGDPFGAGDACQCGDVNGDGPLTLADYQRARAWVVERTSGFFDPASCDVNGDGDCDVEDLAVLDRALNGGAPIVDACEAYTGAP